MGTALLYGSLASSSFVVGVVLGLFTSPPRRLVASVVAFGAGVLVSALTFELMREAFDTGGAAYAISGFLIGAAIYVVADVGLERMAARSPKRTGRDATDVVPDAEHKRESPKVAAVAGTALLVGAVLDGIPESIAIGVSLEAEGPSLGLVLLAAVFLGNVPESLGSAASMREEGRSRRYIIGAWLVVASLAGSARNPGWLHNLAKSPRGTIELPDGRRLPVVATTLTGDALDEAWRKVAREAPEYAKYLSVTDRQMAIVLLAATGPEG